MANSPFQRGFDSMAELHKGGLPKSVRNTFDRYLKSTCYGVAKFKCCETPLYFEGFHPVKVKDEEQNRAVIFIPPPEISAL